MNVRKTIASAFYLIAACLTVFWMISCSNSSPEGMIIVTRVAAASYHPATQGFMPAFPGAALIGIVRDHKGKKPYKLLTPDFYSACSPHVSYDASHILFLGQKKEKDPWQVWEMDLKKKTSRQVTDFKKSCYTPFYLPGNHLVFSREMPDTGTGTFYTLFTMNLDGTDLRQIAYHPNADFITTILKDGRILMHSKQVYPKERSAKYLAMRPNGTKIELFYEGSPGSIPAYHTFETEDGLIWFTEQQTGTLKKKDIISLRYNRPLHSKINHTAGISGDFYAVLPSDSGNLIVSYRNTGDQTIGLYAFSPKDKKLKKILSDQHYHFLDPVLAKPYKRPRNLPNELMCSYPTGLLMSQDINLTTLHVPEKAAMIEVLGMNKSLGIVPVEQDGSFYLKIPANMPFRIRTLDKQKHVVAGPSDWLWVRPFERRGCVGCHEDPELSPENIVPLAINKWPVVIPVDTTHSKVKAETFKVSNMK